MQVLLPKMRKLWISNSFLGISDRKTCMSATQFPQGSHAGVIGYLNLLMFFAVCNNIWMHTKLVRALKGAQYVQAEAHVAEPCD